MKIHRPLWAEGTFLSSQQFQQQARWETYSNNSIAQLCIRHPWGVARVEFDREALALGKLKLRTLRLRFSDGSLIDSEVSDALPLACDLHTLAVENTAIVVLALPLEHANGGNLGQEKHTERPCVIVRNGIKYRIFMAATVKKWPLNAMRCHCVSPMITIRITSPARLHV